MRFMFIELCPECKALDSLTAYGLPVCYRCDECDAEWKTHEFGESESKRWRESKAEKVWDWRLGG